MYFALVGFFTALVRLKGKTVRLVNCEVNFSGQLIAKATFIQIIFNVNRAIW